MDLSSQKRNTIYRLLVKWLTNLKRTILAWSPRYANNICDNSIVKKNARMEWCSAVPYAKAVLKVDSFRDRLCGYGNQAVLKI